MVGRDDRTETAAAYAAKHGEKFLAPTEGTHKHCGRFEHEDSNCYEIIGHPPAWGSRAKNWGRERGSRSGQVAGNLVRGASREAIYSGGHAGSRQQHEIECEEHNNNTLSRLTSNQVQQFLSFIEPSKPAYEKLADKTTWIIDSRASRHMMGDL